MARPADPNNTIDKICPTCHNPFTHKKSKPKTYCCKKCACNSPDVKEKNRQGIRKTFEKNYGCHPMQTKKTKERLKKALTKKYGVAHYSQLSTWKTQVKNTKKQRYGNENYQNTEKFKKTCIERFGVDNPMKVHSIRDTSLDTKKKIHFDYIIEFSKGKSLIPQFTFKDYNGYHYENKYRFICEKCQTLIETDIYNLNHIFCEKCNPLLKRTGENSLYEFLTEELKGLVIKRRDRTILNKHELDFYIPHLKLAIEYNGLYWHSEKNGTKKYYHLNKTKCCLFKEVNLVHIFENEWNNKQEIVKSILRQKFGTSHLSVAARECIIKEINDEQKGVFLDQNHIQGNDRSPVHYGLFYKDSLISAMTFCKSRFDFKCEWEMSRYCNKLNHNVVGGASRLMARFVKDHKPKSIISYSDRRYFLGGVYEKLDFQFVGFSPPGYHYISKDYKVLYNRMGYQKSKLPKILPKFDKNKSEWENMKDNGFDRIWDCGNSKWMLRFS